MGTQMQTIKRAKGGKTLYAKTIEKGGSVSAWTPDPKESQQLDPASREDSDLMGRIVAHHARNVFAGVLTFEPSGKPINDAAAVIAAEKARAKEAEESLALLRERAGRFVAAESGRTRAEERVAQLERELQSIKDAKVEVKIDEAKLNEAIEGIKKEYTAKTTELLERANKETIEAMKAENETARKHERSAIADFILEQGAEKDAEWLLDLVDHVRKGTRPTPATPPVPQSSTPAAPATPKGSPKKNQNQQG